VVEVSVTVETLGAVRTDVKFPLVMVWPGEHVETVVMTSSVVMTFPGIMGDGDGTAVGATIETLDGQFVMIPGCSGMNLAQIPTKNDTAASISASAFPQADMQS